MKCACCGKPKSNLVEILWSKGPNGNRRYKICETCVPKVKKDNESK